MPTRYNPAATLFPLVIVGLLAGMTFWLDMASQSPTTGTDGKSRHDPDYIVENFEVKRFDPRGDLQHTLRAASMQHYPDDDSTTIQAPHLTYHRQPPTLISAQTAHLDSEGKHVQLIKDVRVERVSLGDKPATVLTTVELDAFPDDEIATSKAPVTIVQGRSSISGIGLNANNKTSIYVLDGPVEGLFHRAARGASGTAQAADSSVAGKAEIQPKPKSKSQPKPER
jgi:lipopolysaccharide export system protein LptC